MAQDPAGEPAVAATSAQLSVSIPEGLTHHNGLKFVLNTRGEGESYSLQYQNFSRPWRPYVGLVWPNHLTQVSQAGRPGGLDSQEV